MNQEKIIQKKQSFRVQIRRNNNHNLFENRRKQLIHSNNIANATRQYLNQTFSTHYNNNPLHALQYLRSITYQRTSIEVISSNNQIVIQLLKYLQNSQQINIILQLSWIFANLTATNSKLSQQILSRANLSSILVEIIRKSNSEIIKQNCFWALNNILKGLQQFRKIELVSRMRIVDLIQQFFQTQANDKRIELLLSILYKLGVVDVECNEFSKIYVYLFQGISNQKQCQVILSINILNRLINLKNSQDLILQIRRSKIMKKLIYLSDGMIKQQNFIRPLMKIIQNSCRVQCVQEQDLQRLMGLMYRIVNMYIKQCIVMQALKAVRWIVNEKYIMVQFLRSKLFNKIVNIYDRYENIRQIRDMSIQLMSYVRYVDSREGYDELQFIKIYQHLKNYYQSQQYNNTQQHNFITNIQQSLINLQNLFK